MKLTIDSICLLSSIIDKMDIDDKFIDEMVKMASVAKGKEKKEKEEKEEIQNKVGMKIVLRLGRKLHEVKDDLIDFVASYKEISKEEAKKIDITEVIKELMNDKDFISFFKQKAISE